MKVKFALMMHFDEKRRLKGLHGGDNAETCKQDTKIKPETFRKQEFHTKAAKMKNIPVAT